MPAVGPPVTTAGAVGRLRSVAGPVAEQLVDRGRVQMEPARQHVARVLAETRRARGGGGRRAREAQWVVDVTLRAEVWVVERDEGAAGGEMGIGAMVVAVL